MAKQMSVGRIELPVNLDRSDKELMDALRGPKGDAGVSIRGEKGDKGDPSNVMGPRGEEGPLPSDENIKRLIREVLRERM